MKKYFIIFLTLILVFSGLLFAFGRNRSEEITGMVRLVGNEPFTELVISSKENGTDYFFDKKFSAKYRQYDGKIITIKASIKETTLTLSDGSKSFKRYDIIKSKIIKK